MVIKGEETYTYIHIHTYIHISYMIYVCMYIYIYMLKYHIVRNHRKSIVRLCKWIRPHILIVVNFLVVLFSGCRIGRQ